LAVGSTTRKAASRLFDPRGGAGWRSAPRPELAHSSLGGSSIPGVEAGALPAAARPIPLTIIRLALARSCSAWLLVRGEEIDPYPALSGGWRVARRDALVIMRGWTEC